MTDDVQDIEPDEVDWANATVHQPQRPQSVVSVRLSAEETARLREISETLGITVSQVLRRALAAYDSGREVAPLRRVIVSAFTYGASAPPMYEHAWSYSGFQQLWSNTSLPAGGTEALTETHPTRVTERVLTDAA
jgi:Ribbon-helix-helix protein, copG family